MQYDYKNYIGFLDPDKDRSVLKDVRGVQKTQCLFTEMLVSTAAEHYEALYTLRNWEYKGYPSAYQIYMNSIDETEAAMKLVGSLSHWRKLCSLKWFMNGRPEVGHEGLAQWREDMRMRDLMEAKRVLLEECRGNNVTAARALEKMTDENNKRVKQQKGSSKSKEGAEDTAVVNFLDQWNSKGK